MLLKGAAQDANPLLMHAGFCFNGESKDYSRNINVAEQPRTFFFPYDATPTRRPGKHHHHKKPSEANVPLHAVVKRSTKKSDEPLKLVIDIVRTGAIMYGCDTVDKRVLVRLRVTSSDRYVNGAGESAPS